MVRSFITVAVFTVLFAVSAARISVDPTPSDSDLPLIQTDCDVKPLPESDSNLVVLPIENTKSGSGGEYQVQKSENDKMFRADLTPRSDFARFHAINRHFFAHSRPYRHFRNSFVLARSETSRRNEGMIAGETGDFDARSLHRRGPSSRLKFKHDYGHHHHRRQQHHHHVHHYNKEVVSVPKRMFAREKVKSPVHQHKEQTDERKVSFMRSIRKFLKHTFD